MKKKKVKQWGQRFELYTLLLNLGSSSFLIIVTEEAKFVVAAEPDSN